MLMKLGSCMLHSYKTDTDTAQHGQKFRLFMGAADVPCVWVDIPLVVYFFVCYAGGSVCCWDEDNSLF
jgi:hypothetical protein